MAQPHLDNLNNNGFAVLIGVLIVGAFGAAVVVYLILSGLYSYQNSYILEKSNIAKASANACAEIALNKIQLCSSTIGVGNVQIGNNTCEYNIISNGDQSKTIQATSQIETVVRKIKIVTTQIDPKIVIESWLEVPSF